MTKDSALSPADIGAGIVDADRVLGLGLGSSTPTIEAVEKNTLPDDLQMLLEERETARREKNWKRSDEIRAIFTERGFTITDSTEGSVLRKS